MKVRAIFIAMELAAIAGVIMCVCLTDWADAEQHGHAWQIKLLTVLCAIYAVVMQREQQCVINEEGEEQL